MPEEAEIEQNMEDVAAPVVPSQLVKSKKRAAATSNELVKVNLRTPKGHDAFQQPHYMDGHLPAHYHSTIRLDVALVVRYLGKGDPEDALARFASMSNSSHPDVRKAVVCRILAAEHLEALLKAVHACKPCKDDNECPRLALGSVLMIILRFSGFGAKVPYDFRRFKSLV